MLLSRLRLLRRVSSLQLPLSSLPLPTSKPSSNLSAFIFPPATPTGVGENGRRCLSLPHQLKSRREEGFCTRSTETQETTETKASDPFFFPYLSVRIRCKKRDADTLSEALLCFGASSASMDDLSSFQDLDEIWINSMFADGQDVDMCISHAACSIGLHYIPSYEVSMGEPCDWVANVQEAFHPIEVTDGLWIVPKWKNPLNLEATNIILDPGMAFGTGDHPTTKLCLLLLHQLIRGGEHFLDYGTGSGVLGIAAVKMGADLSVGIDIDPQAVTSARQNIALNGIDSDRMLIYLIPSEACNSHADLEEKTLSNTELKAAKEKFDIVIANILLNPLLELAEDIVAYGKPTAIIGVSGILSEQVQQIKEIYTPYLDNIWVSEMEGWACLCGSKKKDVIL